MLGEELHVRWVSGAAPATLQGPIQNGELGSSSNWQLDSMELASKFTSRTKALVLNTPNNPLGKVLEGPPSLAPCRASHVSCTVTELLLWGLRVGGPHTMSSEDQGSRGPRTGAGIPREGLRAGTVNWAGSPHHFPVTME